jgi:putative transposase
MKKISFSGYRFPPKIIDLTIWLYLRVTLSFRDVEDLLAERGIMGGAGWTIFGRWGIDFDPDDQLPDRNIRIWQARKRRP